MTDNDTLIIGTRHSKLAIWQAEHVKELLLQRYPWLHVVLRFVTTTGDRVQDKPLSQIGGKGLFTRELELAMEQGVIDAAVHSLKDLPYKLPEGFTLAAIPSRGEPEDVLVSRNGCTLEELPSGACVGTSSLRRKAQLLALRPDLTVLPLRGNVDTRLRKLDEGQYEAIILAEAGLIRLGRKARITQVLQADEFVPAAGQGALAVEICSTNKKALKLLAPLHDPVTSVETGAERSFSASIGGSCQIPAGCFAKLGRNGLQLSAIMASPDGRKLIRRSLQGDFLKGNELGKQLAGDILKAGGREILRDLERAKEETS